jgi:hypothetical protein
MLVEMSHRGDVAVTTGEGGDDAIGGVTTARMTWLTFTSGAMVDDAVSVGSILLT